MTQKDRNTSASEIKAMTAEDGEFLRPMVEVNWDAPLDASSITKYPYLIIEAHSGCGYLE
jgi:hypothetical protein